MHVLEHSHGTVDYKNWAEQQSGETNPILLTTLVQEHLQQVSCLIYKQLTVLFKGCDFLYDH